METYKNIDLFENKMTEEVRKFNDMMNISRKCMQINLKNIGLSLGQPAILYTIKHFSDFNQKEVAQICHVKPPTLSRALDSLERNGLIERCFNTDKRRTIKLKLTPLGEEKLAEALKCFDDMHKAVFSDISEEDAYKVKIVFGKIKERLDLYYKTLNE